MELFFGSVRNFCHEVHSERPRNYSSGQKRYRNIFIDNIDSEQGLQYKFLGAEIRKITDSRFCLAIRLQTFPRYELRGSLSMALFPTNRCHCNNFLLEISQQLEKNPNLPGWEK